MSSTQPLAMNMLDFLRDDPEADPHDWTRTLQVASEQDLGESRGTLPFQVIVLRVAYHRLHLLGHIASWQQWLDYNQIQLAGISAKYSNAVRLCARTWERIVHDRAAKLARDFNRLKTQPINTIFPVESATKTTILLAHGQTVAPGGSSTA